MQWEQLWPSAALVQEVGKRCIYSQRPLHQPEQCLSHGSGVARLVCTARHYERGLGTALHACNVCIYLLFTLHVSQSSKV